VVFVAGKMQRSGEVEQNEQKSKATFLGNQIRNK
jgi:hypothetical protein